jgi:hypothetical protein
MMILIALEFFIVAFAVVGFALGLSAIVQFVKSVYKIWRTK